ncbi:hypothetical protein COY33_00750 [candidate division WWE3 bacterium CG_4_10_14_0_2_um_filter_42_7]|uniref:Cohesin domain-containing protein n=2 Tax=Katanobacteria TaxID=422282 RepID=A0A2H0X9H3_UNCKA|nr:MAG: hypothetical protein COT51_02185 [candidate division WWE3 bacterium CG08_land_8_20_14_0_20_41_15]PIZ43847.1 MAG: hypothetical protein COY33_00750 [candidate division WWE3 bacterium CG_4_10_14_0_2_um_filter_42_7]
MILPGILLVLKFISFAVASWVLIHLLAVFGVFLVVAYPLWWFLSPKTIPCFLCQVSKEGDLCRFCNLPVSKKDIHPKNLRSTLLNAFFILIFSIISIGLVYGESRILLKLGFPQAPKTVVFNIPPKAQFRIGEIFPMKIELFGIEKPINAVQADIGFDPGRVEVVDISEKESFAEVFIQKEINNKDGYARLTGGLPNPGFFSDHGIFGTIYLRGKEAGFVKVEFLPSSLVLANDGKGSNVLKDLASASYLILPEEITPEEKTQQKVLLDSVVLGEKTSRTKLEFFSEENVLGAEASVSMNVKKKPSFFAIPLGILEKIDRLILSLWSKILAR